MRNQIYVRALEDKTFYIPCRHSQREIQVAKSEKHIIYHAEENDDGRYIHKDTRTGQKFEVGHIENGTLVIDPEFAIFIL